LVGVFLRDAIGRSSVMMMKSVRIVRIGIAVRGIAMLACCWSYLMQWCAGGDVTSRQRGAALRGRPLATARYVC